MSMELLQTKIKIQVGELAISLKEIVDKFNQLQPPIVDSHVKVPQATKQLDKISEQTEVATQKMLDTIEVITEREQEVLDGLKEIEGKFSENNEIVDITKRLSEKSNANMNDAFSIMNALQFQDITAQQMNHAASMLEDIESKLNDIVQVINSETEEIKQNKKTRSFDPHADMFESKTNQKDIDTIFKQ